LGKIQCGGKSKDILREEMKELRSRTLGDYILPG
jgi:hypothetical protein